METLSVCIWLLLIHCFFSFTAANAPSNHSVAPESFRWRWSAPAAPTFRIFGAHCTSGASWFHFGGLSQELQTCMHDLWILSLTDPETSPSWSRLSSQGAAPEIVVGQFCFPAFVGGRMLWLSSHKSMTLDKRTQGAAWSTPHGLKPSVLMAV